jgi:hypothetical protein
MSATECNTLAAAVRALLKELNWPPDGISGAQLYTDATEIEAVVTELVINAGLAGQVHGPRAPPH